MRVDPVIAALRGDRAPQREAQTRMVQTCDAWRADPFAAQALRELEDFGSGARLADCTALGEVLARAAPGNPLVASFCRLFSTSLHDTPLGHPPLRHGFDGRRSTLLLARSGRAQLTLHAFEPGMVNPDQVSFIDGERHEVVLSGMAQGRIVTIREGRDTMNLDQRPIALSSGTCIALDLTTQCLQITQVSKRLVTLRLMRNSATPVPTRAFGLADGQFQGQAEGDIRTSRQEMMLALLGRMGRADAAPEMAALACEPGSQSLRWQALRESITLDTALGFRTLRQLAHDQTDPLAAPAAALLAQLIEAHPQLGELEDDQCPA